MKNILPILAFLFLPAMLFAQDFDYSWYTSDEASAYTISTAEHLYGLRQLVNNDSKSFEGKVIFLASDIALSGNWTPIGSSSRPFKGTLDGQGYTISGLAVSGVDYAGLFGYVGAGGQIKNLNVVATTIATATATSSDATRYAGGLAAYYASAKPIENCSVKAASITGNNSRNIYSGGLVGYASAALTITNGYASGNVSASGNNYSGYGYGGGLVGYASTVLTITNSYASGNVTAIAYDSGYGGGLAGYASAALTITNSYASGNVTVNKGYYAFNGSFGGGLVGYARTALTITNSYASGNVSASGNEYEGSGYGGGLAGYANNVLTITNSYASGNVSGNGGSNGLGYGYGGGLVGYAKDASAIKTSYASGTISASGRTSYKGGIFGKWTSGTNTYVYYKSGGGVSAGIGTGGLPSGILTVSDATIKNQGSYINWDFNEIWGIVEGISAPYLKNNPGKITVPIFGGLEVEYLPAQTYTGSRIMPEPIVRLAGGATLTKGTDYSLLYGTNKDAGTKGTVTIVGITGDYIGLEETILFDITPKTITIAEAAAQNKTYDGTTEAIIEGALNGVAEGDNVSIGKGVFASKDAGEGISVSNVTLAGASAANYKLTQPTGLTATIAKKDLTITLDPKTVKISVSDPMSVANGHIVYNGLVTGEDKSVISGKSAIFKDAVPLNTTPAAGTYPITLSGTRTTNNYTYTYDDADLFLKVIDPIKFSACTATDIIAQTYTGEQITPAGIAVTCGSTTIAPTNYNISYGDNKNAGATAGKVTITADAESDFYTGSIEKTFAINPKALTVVGAQVSGKVYDGTTEAAITGATVEGILEGDIGNVSVSEITGAFATANAGTDIAVSTNVSLSGAAAANYSITQPALTGNITAKPLAQDAIQAIASQTYTGSEITPSATVKDGSNILIEDTDYTLTPTDNIDAGAASVWATGKGNYKGIVSAAFEILPKELSDNMLGEIQNQLHTGEEITPAITVTHGARTLIEDTDYEVSYSNNINTGVASVSITGKGNYTGEANTSFLITGTTPIQPPQIAASQIRAQSSANAITLQNLPQNAKIEAYTMQGKRIYSSTSHSPLATSLNIPVQTKGIYVIKISLGSQKQILKVPVR